MISKVNEAANKLIYNVLETETFKILNKPRKVFIVIVLWHFLSIKGRINFLQLGRFGSLSEQTYRNQMLVKGEEGKPFLKLIPICLLTE